MSSSKYIKARSICSEQIFDYIYNTSLSHQLRCNYPAKKEPFLSRPKGEPAATIFNEIIYLRATNGIIEDGNWTVSILHVRYSGFGLGATSRGEFGPRCSPGGGRVDLQARHPVD